MVGVEENILPHRTSIEDGSVEEERRLAYVGITRAEKTLSISFAQQRRRYGEVEMCDPSRFIDELPADDIEWAGHQQTAKRDTNKAQQTLSSLRDMLQT